MDEHERRTGLTPAGPRLAEETCARRLTALQCSELHDGGLLGDVDISWHGPAALADHRPASEVSIQAMCGLMEVHGRDQGAPRRLGLEVASVAAGLVAAQGVLAAGIARARGRRVPMVRTSVLQAGLLLLSHYFVVATYLGDAVPGQRLAAPGPPFRSADGRWFEIETLDPEAWRDLWTRLGAGDADLGRGWTAFLWRYERATCSLPPALHEATSRHSLAELSEACRDSGVSLSPLRGYLDVLVEPGTGVDHPDLRPLVGQGEDASGGGGNGLGEHAVRGEPGGADGSAAGSTARRGHEGADPELPLAGIRVVEATSRIQGPFAGMLLRMLGADVVRVQPPGGDYGRAAMSLHRGKEPVQLDLATPGGRAALVDLAADADVFLHNWRPGKAAEWRLGPGELASRNRRLVYAHATGWGRRAKVGRLVGTDFLVQAYAGLGQGLNPEGEPAFPARVILCDLFGGLVAAEGVLAGLYRRETAGGPWAVETSLLAGAMALQAHVLEALADGREDGRRGGRRGGRPSWGVLDRPVKTIDGTLVLDVEADGAFRRLCEACDVDPTGAPRADVERQVADRLSGDPATHGEELLWRAGVPGAVAPTDLAAVASDPRLSALFEPVAGGVAPRSPWSFR